MSAFTHTLSAYEIRFRKRRGFITGETIKFPSIEDLVSMIISSYHDNEICKNVRYILKLKNSGNKTILNNGVERIHITPDSGRRGRPTKMYSIEENNFFVEDNNFNSLLIVRMFSANNFLLGVNKDRISCISIFSCLLILFTIISACSFFNKEHSAEYKLRSFIRQCSFNWLVLQR